MKKGKNNRGFTLGELLIVVGIIAVLVSISIPIFSRQLERSRDAASIANIRSTYSQVEMAYLEMEETGKRQVRIDGVWYSSRNQYPDGKIWDIHTYTPVVNIESKKANNWSGMYKNLPFKWEAQCHDKGVPGKYIMNVTYNEDGSTRCVEVYQPYW